MVTILLVLFFSVMHVAPVMSMNQGKVRVGYKRKFKELHDMSREMAQQDIENLCKLPALAAYRERPYPNAQNCQESAVLCIAGQNRQYRLIVFRVRNLDIPLVVQRLKKKCNLANIYRNTIQQSLDAIPEWARDTDWRNAKAELVNAPQRAYEEALAQHEQKAETFAAQCLVADQLNQHAAEQSGREFCVEFVPHQQ